MGTSDGNWVRVRLRAFQSISQIERKSITLHRRRRIPGSRPSCVKITQHGASAMALLRKRTVAGPATSPSSARQRATSSSSASPAARCRRRRALTPTVGCVSQVSSTEYRAHFGYVNPNSTATEVAVGDEQRFSGPEYRGQPQVFEPGPAQDRRFSATFTETITWTLTGRTVTASSTTNLCPAVLRVDKLVEPENDPGRFTVQIDGREPVAESTGTFRSRRASTRSVRPRFLRRASPTTTARSSAGLAAAAAPSSPRASGLRSP